MVDTNGDIYTQQIAATPTKQDAGVLGGKVRAIISELTVADSAFDADGDTLKICQLPSHARIVGIDAIWDEMDAGADSVVNIGLYAAEGAVIDEDEFVATTTSFRAAGRAELLGTAGTGSAITNQPLWQRAGLTADSHLNYDIVATQTATVLDDSGGGSITFIVRFTLE